MEKYTKISISKNLHDIVKTICDKEGIKMYFFENEAIKNYIRKNYSKYLNENIEKTL